MWKAGLVFVVHRLLLLFVALFCINLRLAPGEIPWFPEKILSFSQLQSDLFKKTSEGDEVKRVQELSSVAPFAIFSYTSNPFYWLAHLIHKLTRLPAILTVVLLSNLFFLLFLNEVCELLSRIITSDITSGAAILVVLWPTSYEMSMGSLVAMSCWLITLGVRQCMEDKWLQGGIAIGLLALADPIAAGVLPLLLYFFWFYQRHFPWPKRLSRAAYLLIPVGAAIAMRWSDYEHIGNLMSHSAAVDFFTRTKNSGGVGWAVSTASAGQTMTAVIFATGAIAAAISNSIGMHRLIPIYLFLVMLFFSTYDAIASRALLAGVCLEGIATISAKPVLRLVQLMFLALSVIEIRAIFS
jgi:hypothetical protein